MERIILIRHGQSQANIEDIFAGSMESPLTSLGRQQAKLMGEYMRKYKVDALYSSDLSRAFDTAMAVAETQDLVPVTKKELREIYAGDWQGKTFEEIKEKYPQSYGKWMENIGVSHPEGGESGQQVYTRATAVLKEILKENPNKTICIVCHAMIIRMMECFIAGKNADYGKDMPWVPNASVTVYDHNNGVFSVVERGTCDFLGKNATFVPDNI